MRRLILDAPEVRAAVSPRRTPEDDVIGEASGSDGYTLTVTSVRFDTGAKRIRLTLNRGVEAMRHLDVTASLLRAAMPTFERAASLAGDLPLPTTPWWQTCSMSEFRTRVTEMTQEERDEIIAQMKLLLFASESEVQATGSFVVRATRDRLLLRRKLIRSISTATHQRNRYRVQSSAVDYDKQMLKFLGTELRTRYGDEIANEIFETAKKAIDA